VSLQYFCFAGYDITTRGVSPPGGEVRAADIHGGNSGGRRCESNETQYPAPGPSSLSPGARWAPLQAVTPPVGGSDARRSAGGEREGEGFEEGRGDSEEAHAVASACVAAATQPGSRGRGLCRAEASRMTTAVPYLRCSTADRGQDPERQMMVIGPWAEREGVALLEPEIDEGTSATKTDPFERERFIEACDRAKAAGAFAIVVECSDRFSRQGAKLDAWAEVELERRYGLRLFRADKPLDQHDTMAGNVSDSMNAEGARSVAVWRRRRPRARDSGAPRSRSPRRSWPSSPSSEPRARAGGAAPSPSPKHAERSAWPTRRSVGSSP